MQTFFSREQLADSDTRESNAILRACVHCGFCTSTCPTYVELGDELDSPRGRIYLIKDMLENDRPATTEVVKHVDRCLSCLSCMSTCPSGVNYMHLVDHARRHIEETYERPWHDRLLRQVLGYVLPRPTVFRAALTAARFGRPFAALTPKRLKAMLALAPDRLPESRVLTPLVFPAEGPRLHRVALLAGCAQQVLAPEINAATIRLLTRHGCEVAVVAGAGCCGALNHHMGQPAGHTLARANIQAWSRELGGEGLDAIVVNTSGCGTTVKDYGFMFRDDPTWAEAARTVSALAMDVSELAVSLDLKPARPMDLRVTYHSACSLQHGQKVAHEPKALLAAMGFTVSEPAEGHLCCGSAGTYNLLQPEIATRLRDRKVANLAATRPDVIAAGNIGCITQIATAADVPVLHTVELLDWATGGPEPAALDGLESLASRNRYKSTVLRRQ